MVKRRAETGGTTANAAAYKTVFVDTSLDTHLALYVADSVSVSDLKDMVVLQHGLSFPEIGEIKIHAVQVKKKGNFYQLPHNMCVKSAFQGANKSWFLYVNISRCSDPNHRAFEIGNTSVTTQSIQPNNPKGSQLFPHMNNETKTPIRPSSLEKNWHADVEVEKDKDLLQAPKGMKASEMLSSDTCIRKNTPPVEPPLNQAPARLISQKDGGSVSLLVNVVSAPNLLQDFTNSYIKDSIMHSVGKVNDLTELDRITKTKEKIGKRQLPCAITACDFDANTKTLKYSAASGVKSISKKHEKLQLNSNTQGRKESRLKHHVTRRKNTSSKFDEVNKSKQEKSLGLIPKALFRDVSSGGFLDEDGMVDSTSGSTHLPSDNLSSNNMNGKYT